LSPTSLLPGPAPSALVLSWIQGGILAAYALAQALLVLYSSHRWLVLMRWWRGVRTRGGRAAPPVPAEWPRVTVQLPIFNERRVVERLIDAVAALDYPRDRLEIQVLDDSTDETRALAARAVERHRADGVDIRLLHRTHRAGFKAGALAAGLEASSGELIAVFDADFVPGPGFLRGLIPHFHDPGVGMVQARWGHLNRHESLVTAAQAVMLDSHFLLEHAVRMGDGLFFNFNGTAGVWRRACIESAGGWTHDTLTEDLDLSYRAQLAGWRFVFEPNVEAPAELPADMEALKSQQRRWAKGSIQTARKLLPRVFAAPLPARVKLEAVFHLTSNFTYPLLLLLGLLLLPVLLGTTTAAPVLVWTLQLGVILLGVVPVTLFLAVGQWVARARRTLARDVAAALVLGVGLSVNNSRAVIEGLGSAVGDWDRTPKAGSARTAAGFSAYRATQRVAGRTEAVLAIYFAALAVFAAAQGRALAVPFLTLLLLGFGAVAAGSLRASLADVTGARSSSTVCP